MTKLYDGHYQMPNGEYRYLDSRDNLDWYNQGRADQRRRDWVVGIACLIAVAIFVVWGE